MNNLQSTTPQSTTQNFSYDVLHGYTWQFVIYDRAGQQVTIAGGFYDFDEAERAAQEWIDDVLSEFLIITDNKKTPRHY